MKTAMQSEALRKEKKKIQMRWPGIEPGSIAWKATMLTIIPPTLHVKEES